MSSLVATGLFSAVRINPPNKSCGKKHENDNYDDRSIRIFAVADQGEAEGAAAPIAPCNFC